MKSNFARNFSKWWYFIFIILIALIVFVIQEFRINRISEKIEASKTENANQKMFTLELEDRLDRISHNFASGGGKVIRTFPSVESGKVVQLDDFFSFDRHHFIYESSGNENNMFLNTDVIDNLEIIKDTYYLFIDAQSISKFSVSQYNGNGYKLDFEGLALIDFKFETANISSNFSDSQSEEIEHSMFKVEVIDGGIGGASAGDSIEITLKPNSVDAPLLYAVFGDNEVFSGKLYASEITINNPKR